MKIDGDLLELLKSAFSDFKRNKIRTLLTSLGIMIGVLSVVMLIALGLGLKNYIAGQFDSMGANLIMLMPGPGFSGGSSGMQQMGGSLGGIKFDERDLATLKRVPGIDYIVPAYMKATNIEGGGNKKSGYVFGTSEDSPKLLNLKTLVGEALSKSEVQSKSKNINIGYELAKDLFTDPASALGKTVRVGDQRYRVTGVFEKKGDPDADRALYMSYRTTFGSLNPDKTFTYIYLGVQSKDRVAEVKAKATELLLQRYKKDDFSLNEQSEILKTIDSIFSILNTVLVAIGSISLLVGGIGIMNIMYATVTERTKEVGIRRAIGATRRDILTQFMVEAVVLSVFGGVMGLLLSIGIVLIVRLFFPASINVFAVLVAIGVSSAIGIFFGVFPARKAANLTPIEAIRFE